MPKEYLLSKLLSLVSYLRSVSRRQLTVPRVCRKEFTRRRLSMLMNSVNAWKELDQRVIDAAVRQWRACLRACMSARGGNFEHIL